MCPLRSHSQHHTGSFPPFHGPQSRWRPSPLWSSEKSMAAMAAMAALTVEPACASLWSSEKSMAAMAALMVEREIPLLDSRAPTGPHHRNGEPLPGLSLTVEPLPDLMVEPLPVMAALTVEPACASLWSSNKFLSLSLKVEHLKVLMVEPLPVLTAWPNS